MSVINCYYIIDGLSLSELVSVSDTGGINVKYFQNSIALPQNKFMPHSQYFLYSVLSDNHFSRNKWLSEGSSHFKYV
jgi:hypothetical protein